VSKLLSFFAVAAMAVPGSAPGQQSGVDARIVVADSLHLVGELDSALVLFQAIVNDSPNDLMALWKAAREAVAVGVMTEGFDSQKVYFDLGVGFAERALEVDSSDFTAEYWLISAQGLRARHASALLASQLGTSVYERAHALLARDSLHPGVNHVLGSLNVEVMKMSRVKRFIARGILGNRAFRDTSWENAEFFLQRAVELAPGFAMSRLDLGRAYFYQEKFQAARLEFEMLLSQELRDPTDLAFHNEAGSYLARIP
jgi:tetratricopeptide (TPR) repeat protein